MRRASALTRDHGGWLDFKHGARDVTKVAPRDAPHIGCQLQRRWAASRKPNGCVDKRRPVSSRRRSRRRHAWILRRRARPNQLRIPERCRMRLYDRRNGLSRVRHGRDVHRRVRCERVRRFVRRHRPVHFLSQPARSVPFRKRRPRGHRLLLLPVPVGGHSAP